MCRLPRQGRHGPRQVSAPGGPVHRYLKRQVDLFVKGDRPHDEVELAGILNRLTEAQVQDILAYLTLIQNPAEVK
jgi:hypothetical protein